MVIINGQPHDAAGTSLAEWLAAAGYSSDRIAVELNGSIIAPERYAATTLADGDKVEIVCFVGGG